MPSMANITVKDAANADVVYVAKVPSSGDRSPARWTLDAASPIIGFRPVLEVKTRENNGKAGRVLEGSFKFPLVEQVNGVDTLMATLPGSFTVIIPTNVDATGPSDGFVQFGNLLASALVRAVADTGYAPT